jgi:aspartate carbamoyltransferase catalytic subunit
VPKDLLALSDLSAEEIEMLLREAQAYKDKAVYPDLSGKIACNLFFEPSTRTQYSFCAAQEKSGMRVISFVPESSSLKKGESFYDTVKTFDSFGVNALVIRHTDNRFYDSLKGHVRAPILNGGDGTGNHPTQSLLDLMTIRQEFGAFEGLRVAIIGDVRHSRVAREDYDTMRRLGMEVYTAGPEEFLSQDYERMDMAEAIGTADVVMMLRVQYERHSAVENLTRAEYHAAWGLTGARAACMKARAIIMHPAPVNRGVEIADDVVECGRSRIFRQMENGVFVRAAALRRAVMG